MKRCRRKPSWNNLSSYSFLCTETLVRWLICKYVKFLSWFINNIIVIIITIIIRHVSALDRPFWPRLIVSSKVFQVVFVHLVYNSALNLTSCCTFLLHVVANLIWICLVSRQLVLLSTIPKYLHFLCGKKGCTWQYFWKIWCRLMSFVFMLYFASM